jgi:hypothetical protein
MIVSCRAVHGLVAPSWSLSKETKRLGKIEFGDCWDKLS